MLLAIITWTLLGAMSLMLLAPESRLGRSARDVFVVAPARFIADMTWTKAARLALLTPVLVVLMIAGPEMIALLAMLGGDLAAIELLVAVWAASVSGAFAAVLSRVAKGGKWLRRVVSAVWRRPARGRRTQHRKAGRKPPASEDEPGWAFA